MREPVTQGEASVGAGAAAGGKAFQDYYPDHLAVCYGCGALNEHGLQIKSYWVDAPAGAGTAAPGGPGDSMTSGSDRVVGLESVCTFTPRPEHTAIAGYVYGGLIASLIDCHGTGTAAAAAYRAEGRAMDTDPPHRFVTAALQVDYLRPTPIGVVLEVRGRVEEITERKVVVSATVLAGEEPCARGRVVAVRMPEHLDEAARRSAASEKD